MTSLQLINKQIIIEENLFFSYSWVHIPCNDIVILARMCVVIIAVVNTLRPRHNCHHVADNIFVNEIYYVQFKFFENSSEEFTWRWVSIGLYNGLVPNRRQVIIWNNDDLVYWRIYDSFDESIIIVWVREYGCHGVKSSPKQGMVTYYPYDNWTWHDVIKWKHFSRYWSFVRGIYRSPVNTPQKGQWRGALMFSLICAWINGWANNREAGDLRRHRAHHDVTVMSICCTGNENFIQAAYESIQ